MSILDEAIPPLEELEPEELKYLRQICRALKALETGPNQPYPEAIEQDSLFDADELGLDPEEDDERY